MKISSSWIATRPREKLTALTDQRKKFKFTLQIKSICPVKLQLHCAALSMPPIVLQQYSIARLPASFPPITYYPTCRSPSGPGQPRKWSAGQSLHPEPLRFSAAPQSECTPSSPGPDDGYHGGWWRSGRAPYLRTGKGLLNDDNLSKVFYAFHLLFRTKLLVIVLKTILRIGIIVCLK